MAESINGQKSVITILEYLNQNDSEFKFLSDEKDIGKQSEVVDNLWKKHFNPREPHWSKQKKTFTDILSPSLIKLFPVDTASVSHNRRFLDLCCSSGGLGALLVEMGWKGIATASEDPANPGLAPSFVRDPASKHKLEFHFLDIADPNALDLVDTWVNEYLKEENAKFDFISFGMIRRGVQGGEEGQSHQSQNAGASVTALPDPNAFDFHLTTAYRNALLIALKYLKPDGVLMWLMREPAISYILPILDIFSSLFSGIEFLYPASTARAPFYILCKSFIDPQSSQVHSLRDQLEIQRLHFGSEHHEFWVWQVWDERAERIYHQFIQSFHALWKHRRETLREQRMLAEAGKTDKALSKMTFKH